MHTATKMLVTTPANSTGSGLSSRLLNIRTKRKISQAKADVAQPEWAPPRCCKVEVQPRRNHRGVHCDAVSEHEKRQSGPIHTFANNILASRYRSRPNSSLRARTAARR